MIRAIVAVRSIILLLVLAAFGLAAGCESEDLLEGLPDAGPPDAGPCEPLIYYNRAPTAFTQGMPNSVANTTNISNGSVTTNGMSIDDPDWQALLDCVRGHLAPFDVQVVDSDPGAVDHFEIVVTASSSEIGLPDNLFSIAPVSCGGNRRGVGFVFLGWAGGQFDDPYVCKSMTHPVGIMAGAHWSQNSDDVMSWASEPAPVGFVDGEHACGGFEAEDCSCTGAPTQNTYQIVRDYFAGACGGGD